MAGLEALAAVIYHERQQEGSMLCAQHALNSLLQGNYFTAPDLASIARSFDVLEQDALDADAQRSSSHNMDDTGFFSVQVIDKALDVWGLHLVRWRSERMRPYQDSPHKLLAFVLNLHQHWFTLRRFGPARTDIESDRGEGHWFNLNSAYVAPKWVSRTYLGMFLEQSEQEGYSVFAVVQADPTKPLALPRTEADHLAATIQAPDSLPGHSSSSSIPGAFPQEQGTDDVVIPDDEGYDINNEDVELQAALAASLAGSDQEFGQYAYVPRAPVPAPAMRPAPAPPAPLLEPDDDDDDAMEVETTRTPGAEPADETDPVAASMARNRQMLEHMKRVQEEALRETYEDEVASGRAQERRRTREEEEQEELERAIAASVAEHNARQNVHQHEVITIDDDEEDEDRKPAEVTTRRQPQASQAPGVNHNINTTGVATSSGEIHRVYDDEDEQLQEALRASLQTMPEGYVHRPSPPPLQPSRPFAPETGTSSSQLSIAGNPPGLPTVNESSKGKTKEENEETEGEDEEGTTSPPPPPAQVDIEEMRRRRLARFTAGAGGSNDGEPQS